MYLPVDYFRQAFRESLKLPQFIEYLHQQQGSHWMIGPSIQESSYIEQFHDEDSAMTDK